MTAHPGADGPEATAVPGPEATAVPGPGADHEHRSRRGASGDPALRPGGETGSLADRQAGLVAALTCGARVPEGFDARLVEVARVALLRKRAGEVAKQWPLLAAGLGTGWRPAFAAWAARRPTEGSLRDGWDLARDLAGRGELPALAGEELAIREVTLVYDGRTSPRTRRAPALHTAAGTKVLQIAGVVRVVRRP